MQLTDDEIRKILIRKKREKLRRQRRRRRRALFLLILLIIIVIVLIKILGHYGILGNSGSDEQAAEDTASARGIIFIDPGHGGSDPGSDDKKDRYEKDDTLRISLAVRDELAARGFRVEMSRTDDESVDRTLRGQMANEVGAQLFISIHRNEADGEGNGVEGFIPKSDEANSRLLGENIMHALAANGFTERTIRAGTLNDPNDDYSELAAASMPAALIEVGFISSENDNDLFDSNLMGNAQAIAKAADYTYMSIYEPDKAAEIAAQEEAAAKIADQSKEPLMKAVEGTSLASDWIASE